MRRNHLGKIYMTACMKGGCAKTVTTYNLAYSLQKLGKKVLCVDFGSQSNLSTCFGNVIKIRKIKPF